MLSVYTRHYRPCQQSDSVSWRCHCPKWIRGVLPDQGRVRMSARTRSWAEAKEKARTMERQSHRAYMERHFAIAKAVRGYLDEQQAREVSRLSLQQSRSFLERRFLRWCSNRGLRRLCELHAWQMREFCCTWSKATTALRWYERLRAFFIFCISNRWLAANPLDGMRKPRFRRPCPTDYFEREEINAILEAAKCYRYGGGHDCSHRAQRMHVLVLLMRWGGLAIKDAVTLERKALDVDGRLFLRRAKTGVPVFVPLPPVVASLLWALPSSNPRYFFWSGNGSPRSAVQGYERSFRKLFRSANLKNPDGTPKRCHAHMFRDTFAVELLLAGVPIDQVSMLLGHRSIKMTEKHYLPWVKARQDQLTASVTRAWFPEVTGMDRNRLDTSGGPE
ncbi:MAG TPA: tyrosine-type recombinase/integrase [Candidatus Angelobacter sp.]